MLLTVLIKYSKHTTQLRNSEQYNYYSYDNMHLRCCLLYRLDYQEHHTIPLYWHERQLGRLRPVNRLNDEGHRQRRSIRSPGPSTRYNTTHTELLNTPGARLRSSTPLQLLFRYYSCHLYIPRSPLYTGNHYYLALRYD
jgi:hypothetical protein